VKGNRKREAESVSGAVWPEAKGKNSPDGKDASPSERTRFGLVTLVAVASLPKMMKPAIGREEMSVGTVRTARGGWGERASRDWSRNLGGPAWPPGQEELPYWETLAGNP